MLKVTETEARQVLKNAFGPLKTELLQNNIWKFSTYTTRNTSLLRYKDQPADVV
jgi:hypothetical protein